MTTDAPSPTILRIDDVVAMTGLSKATIWRRISTGDFPAQVRLGGPKSRAVGWRRTDFEEWVAALQAA